MFTCCIALVVGSKFCFILFKYTPLEWCAVPNSLQKTCNSFTEYPQSLPKYKFNYFVHINRQKISLLFCLYFYFPSRSFDNKKSSLKTFLRMCLCFRYGCCHFASVVAVKRNENGNVENQLRWLLDNSEDEPKTSLQTKEKHLNRVAYVASVHDCHMVNQTVCAGNTAHCWQTLDCFRFVWNLIFCWPSWCCLLLVLIAAVSLIAPIVQ